MRMIINGILLLFCCIGTSFGQDALTELHFEEAEKAYNAQEYGAVIQKLDEVEAIAGPSSKTLYLRIAAEDKLLGGSQATKTTKLLHSLRSNAQTYLEVMAEYGLDDKYREVYAIQEKYKSYPDNPNEWPISSSLSGSEHTIAEDGVTFLDSYEFYDETRFLQLYPSGMLQSRGEMKDGKRVGMWELYDATDNVVWRSAFFDENNPNIAWSEYSKSYQLEQRQAVAKSMGEVLSSVQTTGLLGSNKRKKSNEMQVALQTAASEMGNLVANSVSGNVASQSQLPDAELTVDPRQEGFSVRMISDDNSGGVSETIMQGDQVIKLKNTEVINEKTLERHYKMLSNNVIAYMTLYVDKKLVAQFKFDEGQMSKADSEEYGRIMEQLM